MQGTIQRITLAVLAAVVASVLIAALLAPPTGARPR